MIMKDKFQRNRASKDCRMSVNGLTAIFNMPLALAQNESVHQLPPYNERPVFVVDEYPAAPDVWMHGSGKASSYFVPVVPEHGLWLDFNNNLNHTHDVAIRISMQGIDALTGKKSDPIRLEQYKENCPVHEVAFKQDRFCDSCQHKWPAQNYLTSTTTPYGVFWLDGFMTSDGTVRQFFFTEEKCKGVAAQLIGDDRVYAIGIAFYLSKKPKPKPAPTRNVRSCTFNSFLTGSNGIIGTSHTFKGGIGTFSGGGTSSMVPAGPSGHTITGPWSVDGPCSIGGAGDVWNNVSMDSLNIDPNINHVYASTVVGGYEALADAYNNQKLGSFEAEAIQEIEPKTKLEIGAGAKISQAVHADNQNLDYWEDEPAGFLYINYCDQETVEQILMAGKRVEKKEGFLSGLNLKD